jgi:hypothetical protein
MVPRRQNIPVRILRRSVLAVLASVELLVLLAAFAKPAYGYVDPGSGLLAFQVGGSMLAGGLFIIRSRIRKLFRGAPPEAEKSEPAATPKAEAAD